MEEAEAANRERLQLLDSEREARSQAERASRMKDEFLATLSHELRTPLNAVMGWANILRLGDIQGEELKQGLGIIGRNARIQAQIIEDLLDMSRIISRKVRLDVQWMELSPVVNESIETLPSTAQAKGVYPQARLDPFAGPRSRCCSNAPARKSKSAYLIPARASHQSSYLMFSTVSARGCVYNSSA
jgi:signal transduction histidine kinase